jgi:hypothetical protein
MWHRVAALLGATVEELQGRISSAEFVRWCAFYAVEPWGCEVEHWRMGVVASTVANAAGRKKPLKPSDFIPRPPKKLTPDETRRMLEGLEKQTRG